MPSNQRARFDALLPFYVTNQLSGDDQAFVSDYISQHSDAKSAAWFAEQLARVVRNTGAYRNPEIVLARLLACFNELPRPVLWRRVLLRLSALGISRGVAIALVATMVCAAGGYAVYKFNVTRNFRSASAAPVKAHLSTTIKRGVDVTAVAAIAERFGGHIIQSTKDGDLEKIFINVLDRSELQGLVDALVGSGLIESAVILL